MKKIVLIEDNLDIRETTQEILELADYEVLTAENGKVGVELVKEELPDLVVCDVMMPLLDGYGVLRILSRNPETSNIPFIFLTAKAEKQDRRRGMNLGADDYLVKPFEESELLEVIEIRLKRSALVKSAMIEVGKDHDSENHEFLNFSELNDLSKDRKLKKYKKKEIIFREDDYANYLYFIKSGKVKCFKTDDYGKDLVSEIYDNGEFIGYMALFEDGEYHETAVAMQDSEISVIPKVDFNNLINSNRDISSNFIKLLASNIRDREERMLHLAYSPLRERVANALISLNEKEATLGNTKSINISREDLASLVGTAKESLVRTLSEFKKDNLIKTDGQSIIFLNLEGLKRESSTKY